MTASPLARKTFKVMCELVGIGDPLLACIEQRKPFLRAALYQDLEGERPAARPLDENAVLDGVAGFAKERQRALRHRPVAPRTVSNGRFPASFEDVIAHRAGKGRQERLLAGIRWAAAGGELRIISIGDTARRKSWS